MKRHLFSFAAIILVVGAAANAAEIGHFGPGVPNIRDFVMPGEGLYGVLYNYYYTTDRLNDRNGNKVDSVTINPGPGPGATLGVDVDVDIYVVAPTFIWVSPFKIAGAKYGAYVSPTFASSSLGAALQTQTGRGANREIDTVDVGDLFVQPFWLGWGLTNWDIALGYGFYAPVGRYKTETVTLPVVGPITAEAADNVGLGFWTHQIQGAVSWYPWADKRMALSSALTYEIHEEKEDFDLTPGHNLTVNWGISQYLPLTKDQHLLLELGPAGYSSWQMTDDTGSDAASGDVRDEVHAVGGQLGLTYVPWTAALNVRYFYEFASEDRFQGQSFGLSLAIRF